jgi:hypothetical protein
MAFMEGFRGASVFGEDFGGVDFLPFALDFLIAVDYIGGYLFTNVVPTLNRLWKDL